MKGWTIPLNTISWKTYGNNQLNLYLSRTLFVMTFGIRPYRVMPILAPEAAGRWQEALTAGGAMRRTASESVLGANGTDDFPLARRDSHVLPLALRVMEFLFLVGVVWSGKLAYGQFSSSFQVISFQFHFSITWAAKSLIFSSSMLGYAIGLVATFASVPSEKTNVRRWSIILSTLALAGYANELLRLAVSYRFQFILSLDLLVAILDAVQLKRLVMPTNRLPVVLPAGESHSFPIEPAPIKDIDGNEKL